MCLVVRDDVVGVFGVTGWGVQNECVAVGKGCAAHSFAKNSDIGFGN
jgi:hypothetical protein